MLGKLPNILHVKEMVEPSRTSPHVTGLLKDSLLPLWRGKGHTGKGSSSCGGLMKREEISYILEPQRHPAWPPLLSLLSLCSFGIFPNLYEV